MSKLRQAMTRKTMSHSFKYQRSSLMTPKIKSSSMTRDRRLSVVAKLWILIQYRKIARKKVQNLSQTMSRGLDSLHVYDKRESASLSILLIKSPRATSTGSRAITKLKKRSQGTLRNSTELRQISCRTRRSIRKD